MRLHRATVLLLLSASVACGNDPSVPRADASASRCTSALDCEALRATAMPAGCADARCEDGACVLTTRDDDGDGERASSCVATLPVSTGTDCNDTPGAGASIGTEQTERCDGQHTDENCNATIDEGCACANVGEVQACCSGRGTQSCDAADAGGSALGLCSATTSTELCNGLDDDCDEAVDDEAWLTPDGVAVAIEDGVVQTDGTCTVGTGACLRSGTGTCVGGEIGCSAEAGAPADEVCNLFDDDCDGATDEVAPTLCAVSGQLCTSGTCACPGGQSVCGSACAALGGGCTVGMGACARTGSVACTDGAPACTATAAEPTAEVCDGVDNDCDGTADEQLTIDCLPDPDSDRYATNNAITKRCPDASRATYGNCPAGYVSPTSSLGTDCAPNNSGSFRTATYSSDSDADAYCQNNSTTQCIGASLPGGTRLTSTCQGIDCNDNNASLYRYLSGRRDADLDSYCTGDVTQHCTGASLPNGWRASCSGDDCNDSTSSYWRMASARLDMDLDGWCSIGNLVCAGNTPPPGWHFPEDCPNGSDCFDDNPYVTNVCSIPGGYDTQYTAKACGIGPAQCEQQTPAVFTGCPIGYHPDYFRTETNAPSTCTLVNNATVNVCCAGIVFGTVSCRIVADCIAD